ncbi:MAG: GDSL-type esterase/lipase family protein [Flavobacteriaceae bacterium]
MKQLIVAFLILGLSTHAQEANSFLEEVQAIQKKYDSLWDDTRETVVFTGSSSIRIWNNLSEIFPEQQIINSGFGGSQASDLLVNIDQLVLNFRPKKVFIYEGDNDLASGKKPRHILNTTEEIIHKIWVQNPNTEVVLIAAKPSLARWNLRRKYKKLNRKLKRLSDKTERIAYANVWDTMLQNKKVKEEIFVSDGLHMNSLGYDLWYDVIKEHMN